MRRMSSSTEGGRGHRALKVTVVTGVAVALVATAAAATGSAGSDTPTAAQRPPIAPHAADGTGLLTTATPRGGEVTARFAPRTMADGPAPDVGTTLLAEASATRASTPLAATAAASARTGPTFTALGRTGLSVSTAVGAWSPDGSRFAYLSGTRVHTVRADRTSPVLVSDGFQANDVVWTPQAFTLAVSGRVRGTSGDNLWLASPDGSGRLQLTRSVANQGTTGVAWLGGGRSVVSYGGAPVPTGTSATKSRLRTVVRRGAKVTVTELVPGHPSAALPTTGLYDPVAAPKFDRIAYRQRQVDAAAPKGYRDSIFVTAPTGRGTRLLGTGETLTKPVWSADGKTVYALNTAAGGRSLVAYPAAGGTPTTVIANVTAAGNLFRRPLPAGPIATARATGRDNVASAVSGSTRTWTVPAARRSSCVNGGAQAAVLIRASSFLEAGPANALAIHTCGPLLVTGSARLDARVASELRRILPTGRTVHVVGSTTALAPAVEASLRALKYRTVRYAGADPDATSVVVATKGWKDRSTAVFASARNHTDGLVASVPAGYFGPVLLTDGPRMPKVVEDHVRRYRVGAWAVGPEARRAAPWATNLSGANASDTSVVVARNFFDTVTTAVLVNSAAWQDAIAAGASAGMYGEPLLVTSPTSVPPRLRGYLDAGSGSLQAALVYGRPTVPTAGVLRTVVSLGGGRFAS